MVGVHLNKDFVDRSDSCRGWPWSFAFLLSVLAVDFCVWRSNGLRDRFIWKMVVVGGPGPFEIQASGNGFGISLRFKHRESIRWFKIYSVMTFK